MSNPRLDYESGTQRERRVLRPWIWITSSILLLTLLVSVLLPSFQRRDNPYHGYRGKCLSNLRQIGEAIYLYAVENGGAMPPDLAAMFLAEDLPHEVFVCPTSGDQRTYATQPAALRSELQLGAGHCSYVYLGNGQREPWTKDDVIAFDSSINHGTSVNALFGDGHCESVDGALALQLVSQSRSTTQPIRLPRNRPEPELHSPR